MIVVLVMCLYPIQVHLAETLEFNQSITFYRAAGLSESLSGRPSAATNNEAMAYFLHVYERNYAAWFSFKYMFICTCGIWMLKGNMLVQQPRTIDSNPSFQLQILGSEVHNSLKVSRKGSACV